MVPGEYVVIYKKKWDVDNNIEDPRLPQPTRPDEWRNKRTCITIIISPSSCRPTRQQLMEPVLGDVCEHEWGATLNVWRHNKTRIDDAKNIVPNITLLSNCTEMESRRRSHVWRKSDVAKRHHHLVNPNPRICLWKAKFKFQIQCRLSWDCELLVGIEKLMQHVGNV